MGKLVQDDGRRLPDELWERMEPLLPTRPPHPLGCHNPWVPDRAAMDAIFFVLRTGRQWQALKATGICSPSSANRRFREWIDAGVFEEFWRQGLPAYDAVRWTKRALTDKAMLHIVCAVIVRECVCLLKQVLIDDDHHRRQPSGQARPMR